jgi:hypothetical protein
LHLHHSTSSCYHCFAEQLQKTQRYPSMETQAKYIENTANIFDQKSSHQIACPGLQNTLHWVLWIDRGKLSREHNTRHPNSCLTPMRHARLTEIQDGEVTAVSLSM